MDPASALGVAAAVVQFVDFTASLVSVTSEIHGSVNGQTRSNFELRTVASSLIHLNNSLKYSSSQTSSSNSSGRVDPELENLCHDCTAVAEELITVLERLSKHSGNEQNRWNSFRVALKTLWSQDKIDALQRRLESFRSQISMHILVSLRESLAQQSKDTLRETEKLSQQLLKQAHQTKEWQSDVIDAINRSHWNHSASINVPLENLEDYDKNRFFERLLANLKYAEMDNRYEAIVHAHTKTFEWIFQPPPQGQRWSSFIDWLHSSEPLYWITGKPGAAKSTLMKFLCDDRRTMKHLSHWAQGSGDEVFVSSFYFWCSGTEIQMSQEGLIRTLLHDALLRLPYLTPILFANRLETCMIFGESVALYQPWTWKELQQAFNLFCQEARKPYSRGSSYQTARPKRLVFFIDGLDEFGGSHSDLIAFVKNMVDTNIKVCVSSRPWNIFEDAFKYLPSLRLEDLTFADIKHYVSSKLSANPGFAPLQHLEPAYASQLIQNVTIKASGVFLWVYLVTESLLEGLSDGERLSDLQKRLDALPADLEKLFMKLLNSLGAQNFEPGAQLFRIIRAAVTTLSVLQLSFADEEAGDRALRSATGPYTREQMNSKAELMRRRLNAYCKGLLEVQQDLKGTVHTFKISSGELAGAPVGYLHRTVKDFLQRPEIWSKFIDATPGFEPDARLSEAYICDIEITWVENIEVALFWSKVIHGIEHAVRSDPKCIALQVRLLNAIDRSAQILTTASDGNGRSFLQRCSLPSQPVLPHWACINSHNDRRVSFLHLATTFQLTAYVKICLDKMQLAERITMATSLLEVAIKDAVTEDIPETLTSIYHEAPNAELIFMLLERGAESSEDIVQAAELQFPGHQDLIQQLALHRKRIDIVQTTPTMGKHKSKGSHSFKRFFGRTRN